MTYENVPRNLQRRFEAGAGPRNLDLKSVDVEDEGEDGTTYRVVVNDPDAEEGENPAFFITRPDVQGGLEMFSERLEQYFDAVRREITGEPDETEKELQDIESTLEERGHPGAGDGDVEYGPGPKPNLDGIGKGYDDGDIRVQSTTEADFSEAQKMADQSQETADRQTNERSAGSEDTSASTQSNSLDDDSDDSDDGMDYEVGLDGELADIVDGIADAKKLEDKGHDRAAKVLLEDVREELDEYLDE